MSEISWLLIFHSFKQLLFYEKIILSVRILHSKMKAGAKIIPSQQFSNSIGIGLIIFITKLFFFAPNKIISLSSYQESKESHLNM